MEDNNKFTVLIVDDNTHNLQVLAEVVEESGYEAILAMNGGQALESVAVDEPDLILLDVMMPQMDGYEVCSILKKEKGLKDTPVIFLTARSETEDIVKGFEAGGVDYVVKPFNTAELRMRMKTHLELKKSRDKLKESNENFRKANEELNEANETIKLKNSQLKEVMGKLEFSSMTDPLTGLFNRRHIMDKIEEEASRFKRGNKEFSLIIADIDFFKKVNDTYGHDCGDYVLKQVSGIILESVREIDFVARWGGEEFLILIPDTGIEGGRVLADRIRMNIEKYSFQYNEIQLSLTMTLGVSIFDGTSTIDEIIKKADNAMYEGKKSGRNCIAAR
jgi:two-component system, cell cycle response regulator